MKTKKQFFDGEVSQVMCIVMKRLPKPHVMVEMLTKLDENFATKLQAGPIGGLERSWPEDSEVHSLLEEYAAHPNETWDFAEDYVINLRDIKKIKPKCQVLLFCIEYSEQEEFYMEPLVKFEAAFKELEECAILKDALAVILSLGNILNGGNKTRGQADGFVIDGMTKITSIKDVNNKSGMEYVCKKLKEINEEHTGFKKTLRGLYDSKKNDLIELRDLFVAFMGKTAGVKTKIDLIINDKEDPAAEVYEKIVKKKVESYDATLLSMKERYDECEKKWKKLGEYYGLRKDDIKMEDSSKFFAFWVQFFDALDKHWPKEVKKKGGAAGRGAGKTGAKVPNKGMRMLPLE